LKIKIGGPKGKAKGMRKKRIGLYYPESAPGTIEIYQQRYEKNEDPLSLIQAFCTAFECDYGTDFPEWVLQKLYDTFQTYLNTPHEKGKKDISLDVLLKCKVGKGQATQKAKAEQYTRDLELMMSIDILLRYSRLNVSQAAEIAVNHHRNLNPPSETTVAKRFYDKKWKKKLSKVRMYPEHDIKALLDLVPKEFRKQ
jgi:hypothetical protein